MNVAVILAGGVGKRLNDSYPKQFFKVAGKTVIEHTIEVFDKSQYIDEVVVVINELFLERLEEMVLKNGWKKVKKILKGGAERYYSSLAAIRAYSDVENVKLIFHDAVRPLISDRIIMDTVKALQTYNAVDVAIPAVDTIISVENNFIRQIPERSKLMRGQTPQGFSLDVIKRAYDLALKDPDFKATDDCGVVLKYLPDEPVFVIRGEESNMKLTYKEDTYLLDKLFQLRSFAISEDSMDFTRLEDKIVVIYGGSNGIGAALATLCEQYGAKVYRYSRSCGDADIANRDDVKRTLLKVYEREGQIDFIVNTAAILIKEALNNMDANSIVEIINTNYVGMVNIALESFAYLKESKGQLLFYTSSSYTRGRAFYSLYSSTKAACVNFVQALSQEWEPFGIKVNCINPERTHTQMRVRNFGIEDPQTLLKAEEVALVSVKTLLSDYTGQVIDVKLKS